MITLGRGPRRKLSSLEFPKGDRANSLQHVALTLLYISQCHDMLVFMCFESRIALPPAIAPSQACLIESDYMI